jgi:DNA invertase Pin-like site-specific DNA recombinase
VNNKIICYYRVSRKSQGESGLGLEAQEADVLSFAQRNDCDLIRSYREIETGTKHSLDNRPELRKAIAHAKRSGATLVVAKLDRLLRSTVVCNLLKTSGIQFIACDNPHANALTIDILAAVAEDEGRRISQRTKAALAAFKARGGVLGARRPECRGNLSAAARAKGIRAAAAARTLKARESYSDILEQMVTLRKNGHSLRDIARVLNGDGHTTRRGRAWSASQVARVLTMAH